MEESSHSGVKIAGPIVVEGQVVIVLPTLEESGITDCGLFKGLAQSIGEGGSAVNVVGDALYEVAAPVGDGCGGADIVGVDVIRR